MGLQVYNKYLGVIGGLLCFAGAVLSANHTIDDTTSMIISIIALVLLLLAFKKPKKIKQEEV